MRNRKRSVRGELAPWLIHKWLCAPKGAAFLHVRHDRQQLIRPLDSLLPGGWPDVMRRNRELALAARRVLGHALKMAPPCPDEFIGSLAALPMPDATGATPSKSPLYLDPLQDQLLAEHAIEVPIIPWPAPPKRLLRISAQLYNSLPQYERLARALAKD
jgi:isopenicillin-N epimerase